MQIANSVHTKQTECLHIFDMFVISTILYNHFFFRSKEVCEESDGFVKLDLDRLFF